MPSNLPVVNIEDSAAATKLFFDVYGKLPLEFSSIDVDAAITFFTSKGFDKDAAIQISAILLKQAKLDEIPIFQILDSIRKLTAIELNALVGEILNNNRRSTSTLGYKVLDVSKANFSKNILP